MMIPRARPGPESKPGKRRRGADNDARGERVCDDDEILLYIREFANMNNTLFYKGRLCVCPEGRYLCIIICIYVPGMRRALQTDDIIIIILCRRACSTNGVNGRDDFLVCLHSYNNIAYYNLRI